MPSNPHDKPPLPSPSSAWRKICIWLALLAGWWTAVALLARSLRPWPIALADVGFAAGLLLLYTALWHGAILRATSPRRMTLRALATSWLLAILLLIAELPAAFGMVDYSEWFSRMTGEWDGPTTSFITDWDLGFRHPSHSRWAGRPRSDMAVYWNLPIRRALPMSFTTDKRGFRNSVDRDETDIVLLGDSYIEGAYVSDDETCASVVEQASGLRVTNFGLAGYGTLQELEVLIRHGIAMKPRMVGWFFFEGNDLYNDTDFEGSLPFLRERRPYSTSRWGWSWSEYRARSLTRTVFRALRRAMDSAIPNSVATSGVFRDEHGVDHRMYYYSYASISYDDYERECFDRTQAALRRGRDICKENGIQLVLFYLPMKFRVYGDLCSYAPGSPCLLWEPWNLVEDFAQFCREESIHWVDLTPVMRAEAERGRVLYAPEDTHWNAEGHRFVADLILKEWSRHIRGAP